MADMRLIKDMSAALNAKPKQPSPYDTTAEVTRIDGNTAWVHIPGGVDETPVQMSVNARAGDTVRVRVGGGTAWLVGNDTAPPTDDKKANEAQGTADEALNKINTLEAIQIFAEMIQTNSLTVLGDLDGSGYRCEIRSDGLYIVDPDDETLAVYGSEAYIGKETAGVRIAEDSISMDSHGKTLFSISGIDDAVVVGAYVNTSGGFRPRAGGSNTWSDSIVISATYPFKITINNTLYTYTDYGEYTVTTGIKLTIAEDGFTIQNTSQSQQTINVTIHEYYANGYAGDFIFGDGMAIDTAGNVKLALNAYTTKEPDASLTAALKSLGWFSYVIS